jgi:hypothetical protein
MNSLFYCANFIQCDFNTLLFTECNLNCNAGPYRANQQISRIYISHEHGYILFEDKKKNQFFARLGWKIKVEDKIIWDMANIMNQPSSISRSNKPNEDLLRLEKHSLENFLFMKRKSYELQPGTFYFPDSRLITSIDSFSSTNRTNLDITIQWIDGKITICDKKENISKTFDIEYFYITDPFTRKTAETFWNTQKVLFDELSSPLVQKQLNEQIENTTEEEKNTSSNNSSNTSSNTSDQSDDEEDEDDDKSNQSDESQPSEDEGDEDEEKVQRSEGNSPQKKKSKLFQEYKLT